MWKFRIPLVVFVTALITVFITVGTLRLFTPKESVNDPMKLSDVDQKYLENFEKAFELIEANYYQNTDSDELIEGAIKGMAKSIDDKYTVYYTKEEMDVYLQKSQGGYTGLGLQVSESLVDGALYISGVFEQSPALIEGLEAGDRIVSIDGLAVKDFEDSNEALLILKEASSVSLGVQKANREEAVIVNLDKSFIAHSNVYYKILDSNIGYVDIDYFDDHVSEAFKEGIRYFEQNNIKDLIIDLRDNPGGDFYESIYIADTFLSGENIVTTIDKYGNMTYRKSDKDAVSFDVVILVNAHSASASEILTGALKDNDKAYVIGTKTYGKGLVQRTFRLEEGAGIKVTIARFYTPLGINIHKIGIEPDEIVMQNGIYEEVDVNLIPANEDEVLIRAINYLKE